MKYDAQARFRVSRFVIVLHGFTMQPQTWNFLKQTNHQFEKTQKIFSLFIKMLNNIPKDTFFSLVIIFVLVLFDKLTYINKCYKKQTETEKFV